ncbi:helix-turn-helix transcriptional regulator [Gordonia desulfuricans]|uniref:Helix-turn-helix transcriptional regulator n=1 Tax=Gordonia desulfuricans TaxID=89051 RepID=A0A7K3LU28_9ACTN|nr:helix-turn-helix transcriptional regulator [Gordonia desulfuricans]NDK91763.1 helix-turn-helix transcriptional regulator [Gordonia desulfuricans]
MRVKDGGQVRRWRKQRRYSQRELAFLVRRTQTTIYLIETGQLRNVSEDLGVAIAARLDVPWEDLFEAHEVDHSVGHDSSSSSHEVA